ncbi:MAG: hypothetical protein LN573_02785 [Rickettsia endosymbiont of Oxypoda opaca]|nr:hypothetical protein [Rickettsia endosymbiont of Oxypoda opaca]
MTQFYERSRGLKLVAPYPKRVDPYPVDSDIDKEWVVIDSKTSDEKEISSSIKSKILPLPSAVTHYPADDLIPTGLKLIGAGQEGITAPCSIS